MDSESGKVVETRHHKTVDEFIAALDPRKDTFASITRPGWIFRGQADESWPLVPSSLRADDQWHQFCWGDFTTNKGQVRQERSMLSRFLQISDAMGLHIPEDGQMLRAIMDERVPTPPTWPPREIWSMMGLAQHHGVPTRMLDWSRSSLKAAFFAATEARRTQDPNKNLIVWAFNAEQLSFIRESEVKRPFALITAPSATNRNLHAQEGLFTLGHFTAPDDTPVDKRAFDDLMKAWLLEHRATAQHPWFYRLTLPQILAEELEYEISLLGVTRATQFPDFGGVALHLKDLKRWQRKGGPGERRTGIAAGRFHLVYSSFGPSRAELFGALISNEPPTPSSTLQYSVSATIVSWSQGSTIAQNPISLRMSRASTVGLPIPEFSHFRAPCWPPE